MGKKETGKRKKQKKDRKTGSTTLLQVHNQEGPKSEKTGFYRDRWPYYI